MFLPFVITDIFSTFRGSSNDYVNSASSGTASASLLQPYGSMIAPSNASNNCYQMNQNANQQNTTNNPTSYDQSSTRQTQYQNGQQTSLMAAAAMSTLAAGVDFGLLTPPSACSDASAAAAVAALAGVANGSQPNSAASSATPPHSTPTPLVAQQQGYIDNLFNCLPGTSTSPTSTTSSTANNFSNKQNKNVESSDEAATSSSSSATATSDQQQRQFADDYAQQVAAALQAGSNVVAPQPPPPTADAIMGWS